MGLICRGDAAQQNGDSELRRGADGPILCENLPAVAATCGSKERRYCISSQL